MKVFPATGHVLVEKVNYIKRAVRRSQQYPQGGIIQMEGRLHVSNVQLVCPRCGKPTRIKMSILADGTKQRACKKCHEIL